SEQDRCHGVRRIVPKISPNFRPAAHVCPARTPSGVSHAEPDELTRGKGEGEGGRGRESGRQLKADASAELRLPTGAEVVAVEGALEIRRGDGRQVEGLFAGGWIDSGIADRDRTVQGRIEAPAPVLVEQVEQIEYIHRQLDPRPATGRHGDAITEIEAVDPWGMAAVPD